MGIEKYPNLHILLLNLDKQETSLPNNSSIKGDGCNMKQFKDNQFDIVFSNSVIEHVGNFERQKQFAQEVQRVGKNYFVQTPNYYFPIEPHFMFPFFHWLPVGVRVFLITHFSLGWYEKFENKSEAIRIVEDTRLINMKELKKLFSEGKVHREKYFGLIKSFVITNN